MQSSIWFILLLPIAFVGLALIAVIASQVRKYACYRHELEFKRDLVERGLSIDEIEPRCRRQVLSRDQVTFFSCAVEWQEVVDSEFMW